MLLRLKEDYDGAEPAAASVTVGNLLTLGHLVADETLATRAERTLERYGPQIGRAVRVMPLMVSNLVLWHTPPSQVVLVGTPGADDFKALERVLARHYLPAAVTIERQAGQKDGTTRQRVWRGSRPWTSSTAERPRTFARISRARRPSPTRRRWMPR